jgi:hypothetical protein
MARREYPVRFNCAEGRCRESVTYRCETRAEENEARMRHRDKPWKCVRHDRPDHHLRPGNESVSQVMVASRIRTKPWRGEPGRYVEGLYWLPEDGEHGSGVAHGPGFNAYASDFPEGTRLIVTARVEVPAPGTANPPSEETA